MKNQYVMTDRQIEHFARDISTAQDAVTNGRTTYLRVLVTGIQATLGTVKRGRVLAIDTQLEVLNEVSGRYYAAVLRGVTTEDVAPAEGLEQAESTRRSLERNRRSTFARNAKSVLAGWVKTGGDLRALVAETATYDPLRAATREARGVDTTAHATDRHIRAIARLAGDNAEEVERCIEELQKILDGLSADGNKAEPDTATITQVIAGRAPHTRQPRSNVRQ